MTSVLFDAPGPRARRRSLIGTVIASVLFLALAGVVVRRLEARGQFDMELWGPFINPSDENFSLVWQNIFEGLVATLTAAGLAITLSLVIGTVIGMARMMLGRAGLPLVAAIELFRGMPVVVLIFFAYQALPDLGVDVSPLPGEDGLWYLVIGLTAYNAVIIAEILRAGVASLPSGQGEAARAVGMTELQVMVNVLLPQAFRTMLPALISQLVVVLKDTSLAAIIGLYIELLRKGNLISLNLDNPIQSLFVVGTIFIVINYLLSRLATWVERRLSRSGSSRKALRETEALVPQT